MTPSSWRNCSSTCQKQPAPKVANSVLVVVFSVMSISLTACRFVTARKGPAEAGPFQSVTELGVRPLLGGPHLHAVGLEVVDLAVVPDAVHGTDPHVVATIGNRKRVRHGRVAAIA